VDDFDRSIFFVTADRASLSESESDSESPPFRRC
jgi:hypothetical protein